MTEDVKLDLTKFGAQLRIVKSQEHRVFYVNSSRMGISAWDVRMIVGQVVELGEGQVNEDQATIIMSPEHAKMFLRNLEKTIASYEETFGEIGDPMGVQEKALAEQPKVETKANKKLAKTTKS